MRDNRIVMPLLVFLMIALFVSCAGNQGIKSVFSNQTPYENYIKLLNQSGIASTDLGKTWIEAGKDALRNFAEVNVPYRGYGYFSAQKPGASSYMIEGMRGEKLVLSLSVPDKPETKIFTDLFEIQEQENGEMNLKQIAFADSVSGTIEYDVHENKKLLVRVQPELLNSARYELIISKLPQVAFPVAGEARIGCFWGDPRDGGKRKHEGIDIFAPKGTPVMAVSDGFVTRTGNNRLGGKVVWLSDTKRKQSYYYAHLDSQMVRPGERVRAGDVLGLVGNTGNARTTPPHLHFGIYKYSEGAIDPLPFVDNRGKKPSEVKFEAILMGQDFRTKVPKANVRKAPSLNAPVIESYEKNTHLMPYTATSDWVGVLLPDEGKGYIHYSLIEKAEKALKTEKLKENTPIFEGVENVLMIDSIPAGSALKVFGKFKDASLVETEKGQRGWVTI